MRIHPPIHTLALLVLAAPAFAAWTWLASPVAPLEQVVATGGYLPGRMHLRGEERPGSLQVQRTDSDGTLQYHLELTVDAPVDLGGRPIVIQASLFTQEAVKVVSPTELVLDLRAAPSSAGSTWRLHLAEDGTLRELCVVRHGPLGIGCRKVKASFGDARVERFADLHALDH